jgi:MOSC domain-containing protein YiiM
MKTLHEVIKTLPQIGKLEYIGLRSHHRGHVESVLEVRALPGLGLEGDHRTQNKAPNLESKRQVTLIQAEHLAAVASLLGLKSIDPSLTRRNLVISGINLLALKDKTFFIGEVLLEYSGPCHPCTRMEETFGSGGYNAMRGHGGITARVLREGVIQLGDNVYVQQE